MRASGKPGAPTLCISKAFTQIITIYVRHANTP